MHQIEVNGNKAVRLLQRADGTEIRITGQLCHGTGLTPSVDVYVHHRASPRDDWKLASDRPQQGWKQMPRAQYLEHGRSEMFRLVSHGEIFSVTIKLKGLSTPSFVQP